MHPLAIAAGVGLGALALNMAASSPPPAPPPISKQDEAAQRGGAVALPVVAAAVSQPPVPPKLEIPKAAGSAATVAVGIKVNNAVADAVEKVAGQGAGDLARLNISAAVPLLAAKGTQALLVKAGAPPEVAKHAGITVGAVAVAGLPGLAIKGAAEAASLAIKLVAGKKVEEVARGTVRQFDPTLNGSVANKLVVQPASKVVKALGKIF